MQDCAPFRGTQPPPFSGPVAEPVSCEGARPSARRCPCQQVLSGTLDLTSDVGRSARLAGPLASSTVLHIRLCHPALRAGQSVVVLAQARLP